jgi:ribosomal-protein-alanine N-acetyltransferase
MRRVTLPPAVPRLHTPRLVLRALDPGDADDIFAYAADPEVAQYTLWRAHTSLEESRQFIAWLTKVSMACWALVHPDTGHVIGTSFLHSYHAQHQRAEIAFNLAKALWGQGYATEAARAVIRVGFLHYGLNRIEGTCMLGNVASARVMEKVGMRFEGMLRQYVWAKEAFHDMKLYAILRADIQELGGGERVTG